MDKCPNCGQYLLEYDSRSQKKRCKDINCNYSEWYCREKWNLEHDELPLLLGKKREIKGKCKVYDVEHYAHASRLTGSCQIGGIFITKCLSCECMPDEDRNRILRAIIAEVI